MFKYDENKLQEAMRVIDEIANIFEIGGKDKGEKLAKYEKEIKEITGNENINITDFFEYYAWTSLEEIAKMALTSKPIKKNYSNEELTKIILKISSAEYTDAENRYYLELLERNWP